MLVLYESLAYFATDIVQFARSPHPWVISVQLEQNRNESQAIAGVYAIRLAGDAVARTGARTCTLKGVRA